MTRSHARRDAHSTTMAEPESVEDEEHGQGRRDSGQQQRKGRLRLLLPPLKVLDDCARAPRSECGPSTLCGEIARMQHTCLLLLLVHRPVRHGGCPLRVERAAPGHQQSKKFVFSPTRVSTGSLKFSGLEIFIS